MWLTILQTVCNQFSRNENDFILLWNITGLTNLLIKKTIKDILWFILQLDFKTKFFVIFYMLINFYIHPLFNFYICILTFLNVLIDRI